MPPATRPVSTPSVLIVDSDRRVRQSLAGLVALTDGLVLGGTAGSATEALARLESQPVDVVLLDVRLPNEDDGVRLMDQVRARWPRVTLVVMSCSEESATAAMQRGATAFVAKSGQPETIVDTLLRRGRAVPVTH